MLKTGRHILRALQVFPEGVKLTREQRFQGRLLLEKTHGSVWEAALEHLAIAGARFPFVKLVIRLGEGAADRPMIMGAIADVDVLGVEVEDVLAGGVEAVVDLVVAGVEAAVGDGWGAQWRPIVRRVEAVPGAYYRGPYFSGTARLFKGGGKKAKDCFELLIGDDGAQCLVKRAEGGLEVICAKASVWELRHEIESLKLTEASWELRNALGRLTRRIECAAP